MALLELLAAPTRTKIIPANLHSLSLGGTWLLLFRMYTQLRENVKVRFSFLTTVCCLAVILTSCTASQVPQDQPSHNTAGVVCDRFNPLATLEGNELVLSLDTDLPDSTVLMVSVSRSYWNSSTEQEYPLDYLSTRSTVGEWRKPHKVSVSHNVWAKLLDDRMKLAAKINDPLKIKSIKGDIEASFTVPISQTDPRFGQGNENLRGAKVPTSGIRAIRAEKLIPHPLGSKASAPKNPYAPREALQSGSTYTLPKEVPLMPQRDSADPLGDLEKMRRLPAKARITIVTVDRRQPTNPWYQVKAVGPTGDALGTGWINSLALIGSDILQVR